MPHQGCTILCRVSQAKSVEPPQFCCSLLPKEQLQQWLVGHGYTKAQKQESSGISGTYALHTPSSVQCRTGSSWLNFAPWHLKAAEKLCFPSFTVICSLKIMSQRIYGRVDRKLHYSICCCGNTWCDWLTPCTKILNELVKTIFEN